MFLSTLSGGVLRGTVAAVIAAIPVSRAPNAGVALGFAM